jgi:hypothetical protein
MISVRLSRLAWVPSPCYLNHLWGFLASSCLELLRVRIVDRARLTPSMFNNHLEVFFWILQIKTKFLKWISLTAQCVQILTRALLPSLFLKVLWSSRYGKDKAYLYFICCKDKEWIHRGTSHKPRSRCARVWMDDDMMTPLLCDPSLLYFIFFWI